MNENPVLFEFDFKTKWNMNVRGKMNYDRNRINSKAKATEIICDIQRTNSNNFLPG